MSFFSLLPKLDKKDVRNIVVFILLIQLLQNKSLLRGLERILPSKESLVLMILYGLADVDDAAQKEPRGD